MGASNQIRIIGGQHRGRKLDFADLPGLRPTGDRMRETLFNWLQPVIAGARCLDLFAGSGALGFEAASRGAGRVVLVDRAQKVVDQLHENVRLLRLDDVEVVRADGMKWLQGSPRVFDVLFLDPPFAENLLLRACRLLTENGWLAPDALIYLETDATVGLPDLPQPLVWEKHKRMGQVAFGLARYTANTF